MPLAITPKDHSIVLANLVSLAMEPVALVNITYLNEMSRPISFESRLVSCLVSCLESCLASYLVWSLVSPCVSPCVLSRVLCPVIIIIFFVVTRVLRVVSRASRFLCRVSRMTCVSSRIVSHQLSRVLLFYYGILVTYLLRLLCLYARLFILMCCVFSRFAGFVVLGFVPCCIHRMVK